MAAIGQKHRHLIQATHFIRIGFLRLRNPIDLQRHRIESLLQANQALGESRHGLGQILGGSRDPEGDRFSGHDVLSNCPAYHHSHSRFSSLQPSKSLSRLDGPFPRRS